MVTDDLEAECPVEAAVFVRHDTRVVPGILVVRIRQSQRELAVHQSELYTPINTNTRI